MPALSRSLSLYNEYYFFLFLLVASCDRSISLRLVRLFSLCFFLDLSLSLSLSVSLCECSYFVLFCSVLF